MSGARREDGRILRGQTRYLDDIVLPGVAEVAFVRSPYAHASIDAIEVPEAVTAVTAADLDGLVRPYPLPVLGGCELAPEPHPVLAAREVRYVGQPVALVAADSRALAEDLAERVQVSYTPRPAVMDPRDSTTTLMRFERRGGDIEDAFAAASHVVSGSYGLPRLAAYPIETRGAIARCVGDELTIWCSAQDPHRPRAQLRHILGRDVRVIVPDVGGAFGSKGVIAPEIAALAAAAVKLGVPLKWSEDRLENLLGSYQGRGIEGELELALDGEGRMLGLRARLLADLGGYLLPTTAVPPLTAAMLITGCYEIAAAEVQVTGVATNRVPTGPYRGAGRPDAAYMLEAIVDRAARELGLDRVQLRRRNLIRRFPHRTPLGFEYDSGDFERCLDLAVELSQAAPGSGTGVAMYVERAGGQWEAARVELLEGGRFEIATSACAHGQGHETTFAQLAAARLGVDPGVVEVRYGDSAEVPEGVGTFGSRSVAMAGSAIVVAIDRLIELALARVGGSADEIDWVQVPPMSAEARFESPLVFSSGAHAATVTIDPATGALRVLRVAAVDDAGTVINPQLVHGQVVGGVAQSVGECLIEEALVDEPLDYRLPTAAEMPTIATSEVASPTPLNPLGAKGAGEGGAVGALPAIANAVADALGGRHLDPPYTAEKLWRALQDEAGAV
jgi:aerobic carbon-monoxide dehydrogenase large subunit